LTQLRKSFEAKLIALERSLNEKDEVIRGLKVRVVRLQASHSSNPGPKSINLTKVEKLLGGMKDKIESLALATRENFSSVREQLDLIDGVEQADYEPSSIQEEAVVKPVRATHSVKRPPRQAVTINLAQLESSLGNIETNRFSTIYPEGSVLELNDSMGNSDLRLELQKQSSLIKKHEGFINQLKSTLETLLGERLGPKKHQGRDELRELRNLLKFDESM
jgi:hypothetical protein